MDSTKHTSKLSTELQECAMNNGKQIPRTSAKFVTDNGQPIPSTSVEFATDNSEPIPRILVDFSTGNNGLIPSTYVECATDNGQPIPSTFVEFATDNSESISTTLVEFATDNSEPIPSTSKELQDVATDNDEPFSAISKEFQMHIPGVGDSYPHYREITEISLIYAIPKSLFTDESKFSGVTIEVDEEHRSEKDIYFTRFFTLKCYPNGDCKENEGYISFSFEKHSEYIFMELQNLNITLALLDSDKNQRFSQSFTLDHQETIDYDPDRRTASDVIFGLNRYVKRDTLMSSDVLCGEKLLLQCDVQYYTIENVLDEDTPPYNIEECYDEAGHHFTIILETSHPLWFNLCNRSSYFNKLINIDGATTITSYDNSERRGLEIIGRCIMSGTDPEMHELTMQEVFNLYEFADYVMIDEFQQKCRDILKNRMTPRIACNVVAMADMHSDSDLKKFAMQYSLQHWRKVIASKSWVILNKDRPDLAKEMNESRNENRPSKKRKREPTDETTEYDPKTVFEHEQQFQFYQ